VGELAALTYSGPLGLLSLLPAFPPRVIPHLPINILVPDVSWQMDLPGVQPHLCTASVCLEQGPTASQGVELGQVDGQETSLGEGTALGTGPPRPAGSQVPGRWLWWGPALPRPAVLLPPLLGSTAWPQLPCSTGPEMSWSETGDFRSPGVWSESVPMLGSPFLSHSSPAALLALSLGHTAPGYRGSMVP
jgi:hypothetical protein